MLADGLRASGYEVFGTCAANDRGVMIAARRPVAEDASVKTEITLPSRTVHVTFDGEPTVNLLGIYIPSRDRSPAKVSRKADFIESLLAFLERLPVAKRDALMIVGDFNVVSRQHEPSLRGYFDFEYELFEALEQFGFAAGHELRPGKAFPHSWIGRTGVGYLYDYVFAGRGLQQRIARCSYLHAPRTSRLTDHAAITVACQLGTPDQAAVSIRAEAS